MLLDQSLITGLPAKVVVRDYTTRYLRDFLGFEEHMRRIRARRLEAVPTLWYERPYYYTLRMAPDRIFGHTETIYIPRKIAAPDYEFEIACLIPRSIRTTKLDEAIRFVTKECFFTIMNDWSARDFQKKDMGLPLSVTASKSMIGKSFGPYWVPGGSLSFDFWGVPDITMALYINEELRTETNFQTIYFIHPKTGAKRCWGFAQIIVWLNEQGDYAEAGDIIGSGTVGRGSIAEFAARTDPKTGEILEPAIYPWIQEDDVIEFQASGIGSLQNSIRRS